MNITRRWHKLMAVGCTHAHHIDPVFESETLAFRERWKPKVVVHLGDWSDTEGLLRGGEGSGSEGESLRDDMETGLSYLERLGVTHCTMGNHDERPYRFLKSTSPVKQAAAELLVERIESKMKSLRIHWQNSWSNRGWILFGGFKFMHGYMYGENATRDHAIAHGKVVHAHTHRSAFATAPRDDNAKAFCVGTGTRMGALEYAKTRKATLAWSQAVLWGEYTNDGNPCGIFQLYEHPPEETKWRMPV